MCYRSSEILTVFENAQHISDAVLDMVTGIANVVEEPPLDEGLLFLGQPLYLLGEIRNGEVQENRCDSGDETLCVTS